VLLMYLQSPYTASTGLAPSSGLSKKHHGSARHECCRKMASVIHENMPPEAMMADIDRI